MPNELSGYETRLLGETDGDRLAWLDARHCYIEIGESFKPGSAYVAYEEGAWRVRLYNGARYERMNGDDFATLRDAIAALKDCL